MFASLTVQNAIDSGGQGAVFRAAHGTHGECALKIYTPESQPRVAAEVHLLRSIDHPNIIKIIDSGHIVLRGDTSPYTLMPFVDGSSIKTRLDRGERLDEAAAKRVLGELASAIETLWASLKVHRDIKPGNVLIDAAGSPVLIDFGITRHLDMTTMTVAGAAPGTAGYKSPEQSSGYRHLTYRSDVFSLAVTVYEAMCGEHPFRRRQDLIDADSPVVPLDQQVACSPELSALIGRMLLRRPVLRPTLPEIIQAVT